MSHYSVAVFTEPNGRTVEELLARYDESIEVDPYVFMTKKEAIEHVRKDIEDCKNGKYAEYLANPSEYEESCKNKTHIKFLKEEFPERLNWTDEECYEHMAKQWGKEDVDEDGNLITTYNPDSKWDWYVEGGRFSDEILLKTGERVGWAKVKDIDFSPDEETRLRAERFWEIVVEDAPLKDDEERPFSFMKKEYYLERFKTKEKYAQSCANWRTYAVVTPDGEWHEPGKMGWFGMSDASIDDETKWDNEFYERFIETADPEWTLTVVDCHI